MEELLSTTFDEVEVLAAAVVFTKVLTFRYADRIFCLRICKFCKSSGTSSGTTDALDPSYRANVSWTESTNVLRCFISSPGGESAVTVVGPEASEPIDVVTAAPPASDFLFAVVCSLLIFFANRAVGS